MAKPVSGRILVVDDEMELSKALCETLTAQNFAVTGVNSGKDATFTAPSKAGTYKFHCKFHSQMHGT